MAAVIATGSLRCHLANATLQVDLCQRRVIIIFTATFLLLLYVRVHSAAGHFNGQITTASDQCGDWYTGR